MAGESNNYFARYEEPLQGLFLFLRKFILDKDPDITQTMKYQMPFFCYKGKIFCYFWIHKKLGKPYIGFMEGNKIDHPDLVSEGRARVKILLLDPDEDIPVEKIDDILTMLLALYHTDEKLRKAVQCMSRRR